MMNLPGNELIGWTFWSVLWMNHEQHVWESGSKVGAIGVVVLRGLRCVNVHALRAVELDHSLAWNI